MTQLKNWKLHSRKKVKRKFKRSHILESNFLVGYVYENI